MSQIETTLHSHQHAKWLMVMYVTKEFFISQLYFHLFIGPINYSEKFQSNN